jgi:predicted glycosyltransferase
MTDSVSNKLDAPGEDDVAATHSQPDAVFINTGVRGCRIALYSHDTVGLGHMRRNLAIAEALVSCKPRPVILMITGSREIGVFSLPAGVDSLALPALYKELDGSYRSRCLDVDLGEIRLVREKIIHAALEAFGPDVFIVDKEPAGGVGELLLSLASLRRRGHTRCVLGLRDIIDDPTTVQTEWNLRGNYEIIRRYYDAVWVYGDPSVYDLVREYEFPDDIAAVTFYTGYLGRCRSDSMYAGGKDFLTSVGSSLAKLVICTVGGGQDGAQLAKTFTETGMPPDTCGLLLTGPHMPGGIRQRLHARAAARSDFRVIDFAPRPVSLLQQAQCLITMGGYNTVCEALSLEKRTLVVPRISPRQEQLIRAERMRELGLLDILHPDEVTPGALKDWLCEERKPASRARAAVDLNGMKRLPGLLLEILNAPSKPAPNDLPRRLEHVK